MQLAFCSKNAESPDSHPNGEHRQETANRKRPVMTRPHFGIARFMQVTAAIAAGLLLMRLSVLFGCLVLALVAIFVGRSLLFDLFELARSWVVRVVDGLQRRTVGRLGLVVLTLFVAAGPYILFFDPVDYWPLRAHVAREPLSSYLVFSDDVAYVASSRNWQRTVSNLFEPHNTHIVPSWRVLTWALATATGNLERLPETLAVVSYSILIAAMLLTGRVVARETGRTSLGLAAMALVGTTSVMLVPATWYSAGQPLWAGVGILATLWYAQSYRRSGRWVTLLLGGMAAVVAGWFWTIGYAAGPAAAVYLWQDGRARCRLAAIAPLLATALAIGIALTLGGRHIDSTISLHGRDVRTAANPVQGVLHTCQAIPENLIFANLGLSVQTTTSQGVLLTLAVILAWSSRGWFPRRSEKVTRRFGPLECAGAITVASAYLVEWTFRGYIEFQFLRTMNIHFIVPWYDAVPQIGTALLLAGWYHSRRMKPDDRVFLGRPKPPNLLECLGVVLMVAFLIGLNRPRIDELVRASVPPLVDSEKRPFALLRLQTMRASVMLIDKAAWQRRYLRRLDRCEVLARRMGCGRDTLRAVFGHRFVRRAASGRCVRICLTTYDVAGAARPSRSGSQCRSRRTGVQWPLWQDLLAEEPGAAPRMDRADGKMAVTKNLNGLS